MYSNMNTHKYMTAVAFVEKFMLHIWRNTIVTFFLYFSLWHIYANIFVESWTLGLFWKSLTHNYQEQQNIEKNIAEDFIIADSLEALLKIVDIEYM